MKVSEILRGCVFPGPNRETYLTISKGKVMDLKDGREYPATDFDFDVDPEEVYNLDED